MKNYKQVKLSGHLNFQEFNSTLNEMENIKKLGEEIFVVLPMKIGNMLPSRLLCLHN